MGIGVHAILGRRGHGKSRLARAILAPARRLLVSDTLGEHSALGELVSVETLQARLSQNPDAYRFVHRPRDFDAAEWLEGVAAARPGITLFIDEVDMWYPSAANRPGEGLLALVRYGRHYDQGLVAVARRPAAMSREITSQATLWVYPMTEPRDRQYVRDIVDFDPIDLQILETSNEGFILKTELARIGLHGVEIGQFDLVAGQYTF